MIRQSGPWGRGPVPPLGPGGVGTTPDREGSVWPSLGGATWWWPPYWP